MEKREIRGCSIKIIRSIGKRLMWVLQNSELAEAGK
jgi:hypothetical protein